MKKSLSIIILTAMAAVMLAMAPTGAAAQTVRGDTDWDGDFDVADLSYLIDYLLQEQWSDIPEDVERMTFTVKGVDFTMVHVDAGILTRDDGGMYYVPEFWIGETEVTRGLWAAVMGGTSNDKTYPASEKTGDDCQALADSLCALTGMPFRLPTCNEWEFAARGGNRSMGYTYCGGNRIELVAWYSGNSSAIKPVAKLKCNELGLYDMSGNVCEWCHDTYYPEGSSVAMRYLCGGHTNDNADGNKPSARRTRMSNTWFNFTGTRLAMSPSAK